MSRLTPGYWANRAIHGAMDPASTSAGRLAPLVVDCGLCALFALAVLAVGLALGRSHSRSSL